VSVWNWMHEQFALAPLTPLRGEGLGVRGCALVALNRYINRSACTQPPQPQPFSPTKPGEKGAKALWSTCVPFAFVLFAIPACAEKHQPVSTKIPPLVEPYTENEIINAISIGVLQQENTWTGHYGQLAAGDQRAPDDETVYEIGSMTKVFTGILLADAVIQGKVQIDTSIGELWPELQEQNPKLADSITLQHLATHVSGLPRMPINFAPADPNNPYADYDRVRLLKFLSHVGAKHPPGEESEYSNLAAGLLGELLAMQAETSYGALLQQRILGPLEMDHTGVALTDWQEDRLAPPHVAGGDPSYRWDFDALAGAGAIRSTAADLLRFLAANLDPPDSDLGRAIELAWQQHQAPIGDGFAMGLGWHIARDGHTRWHNGQTGGYHGMMLLDPRSKTGVVALSNTATMEVDALAESILRALLGIDEQPREFPATVQVDAETVARLAGRYEVLPGFILTVRPDGDKLYVQATGQGELRVFPESETKWRYKVVPAELTFELPEEGPATALTLHQNGRDMRGARE